MALTDESVWHGTIYSGASFGGAVNLEAFTDTRRGRRPWLYRALSLLDRYRWLRDDR
jgi:hypothetical protein